MFDAEATIRAIDEHLAGDEKQLRRVVDQANAVQRDFEDLIARLRREIDASTGLSPGACHLRG